MRDGRRANVDARTCSGRKPDSIARFKQAQREFIKVAGRFDLDPAAKVRRAELRHEMKSTAEEISRYGRKSGREGQSEVRASDWPDSIDACLRQGEPALDQYIPHHDAASILWNRKRRIIDFINNGFICDRATSRWSF